MPDIFINSILKVTQTPQCNLVQALFSETVDA